MKSEYNILKFKGVGVKSYKLDKFCYFTDDLKQLMKLVKNAA